MIPARAERSLSLSKGNRLRAFVKRVSRKRNVFNLFFASQHTDYKSARAERASKKKADTCQPFSFYHS